MAVGLTYSRAVAWLKVLFPLAALILLSTMFLFSRAVDTTGDLPIAQVDLEQRAREQLLTGPRFSGTTPQGDIVTFTAKSAQPDIEGTGLTLVNDLNARIDYKDGTTLTLTSQNGQISDRKLQVTLKGSVVVVTSDGYTLRTEEMDADLKQNRMETAGEINGTAPFGTLQAGKAIFENDKNTNNIHLFFTKGVKLVYIPK